MVAEKIIEPIQFKFERPSKTYTLEDYMRREAQSAYKHEFINGKIIRMPNAKGPHNIIASNMMIQMGMAFEIMEKDYTIFNSDQKVYFPSLDEGVYADALAVSQKPSYWDKSQLLLINPILVVEVLSKRTEKYDKNGKFDKYKTLDSFQEYILIRQDMCYAEVWFRAQQGVWHETIIRDLDAQMVLKSVGITISMRRIYKNIQL
jgi:Uma2 family endonuclease